MPIDLTAKSNELKEFVRQFETKKFLGDLSMLMQHIRVDHSIETLRGLSSPQRQLLYLAGLNLSTNQPEGEELKHQYTEEDFEAIKKLLNEIEEGYQQFFLPNPEEEVDDAWKHRRQIAMGTFLNYFNQGLLNYEEQIIERISEYFSKFDPEITAHFGLSLQDFLDMFEYIDALPNKFLMEKINPKEGDVSWQEFAQKMMDQRINPDEWMDHMPGNHKNVFEWMSDQGSMNRFTRQELIDKFGEAKTTAYLNVFTCQRQQSAYLYYTEKNPVSLRPVFQIDKNTFQIIERNQLLQATYRVLFEFCTLDADRAERFYRVRGKKMEQKIIDVFQRFFKGKAIVHRGFFTQEGHEQDLLFIIDGLALIVESKASRRAEPRRDPDKAYPLILNNFNETIQKGYDQTYRVKEKFIDRKVLKIYKDQELTENIIDIRTKNYHSAFSIVVTLERYGQIQTDLHQLLVLPDDDEFPWSVCVDDLETFLLAMEKMKMKMSDLIQFLKIRERLHGRLFCGDELEVGGAFLERKLTLKHTENKNIVFGMTPDLTDIFDMIYQTQGLGFKNEKNMEMKTGGRYMPLGGY